MSEIHSKFYSEIERLKQENEYLKINNGILKSDLSEMKNQIELHKKLLYYYDDSKNYDGNYVDCGKDAIKLSEPLILKDKGDIARTVLLK